GGRLRGGRSPGGRAVENLGRPGRVAALSQGPLHQRARPRGCPPLRAMSRLRVVVLRPLGLGDLLTGIPAMRAIARGFPDHERVLAAPAPLAPLAMLSGAVDHVSDT